VPHAALANGFFGVAGAISSARFHEKQAFLPQSTAIAVQETIVELFPGSGDRLCREGLSERRQVRR